MTDSKSQWKKSLVTFTFLFVIYEIVLVFGTFLFVKMLFLNIVNPPIIGFMFEGIKESIQRCSFFDFLNAAKELCLLLTCFSFALAYGSME